MHTPHTSETHVNETLDRVARERARIRRTGRSVRMSEQMAHVEQGREILAVTAQAAAILEGYRRVFTTRQYKLDKASASLDRWVNRGLTLSPADEASPYLSHDPRYTMCRGASDGCRAACVGNKTGQNVYRSSRIARIGRTIAMHADPVEWWARFSEQMGREIRRASRQDARLAFRCNVASDRADIAGHAARLFPEVEFYDYTAITSSVRRKDGVHRVYSLKEGREALAKKLLSDGYGVAVVLAIPSRGAPPIPDTWEGYPMIDGDKHDLFFLQAGEARRRAYGTPERGGYVVGLRVKGSRRQAQAAIDAGFAVPV